jgi:hypothetical protein
MIRFPSTPAGNRSAIGWLARVLLEESKRSTSGPRLLRFQFPKWCKPGIALTAALVRA